MLAKQGGWTPPKPAPLTMPVPDYGYEEPFGDPTEDDLLYLIAAERRRTHSVKRGNRTEKVPKRPDLIATYEAKLAQLTGAA